MSTVLVKTYAPPPFCEREILRYAGCKGTDETLSALLQACLDEVKDKLVYKVCYIELPVRITDGLCDFSAFSVRSKHLAKNLRGTERAIVFAATVGVEIDRLIAKYGRLAPSKALLMQAIGAERIEALCDAFCADMEGETRGRLKPRFSAGYGDLPLEAQREIIALLDCAKKIGVCLNESLLMSPSKSVTAFVGIDDNGGTVYEANGRKCAACDKNDCDFRREI
ncbi:MAG: Vitamin B12 dependent methionine synthase activation subunit [Clostridia bacterium]|nr:Vitamin B12 dependent methionine synthase activation subunit [Clostridia bacterium]